MLERLQEMSAVHERGHVFNLAGPHPEKALILARSVSEPWYRAQSLAFVAWRLPEHCIRVAKEAAIAAETCISLFEQSAVRVWEIEALARCGFASEAIQSLRSSVETALRIETDSGRSESLLRLLESSCRFEARVFERLYDQLVASCDPNEHWRCKMNLKHAKNLKNGNLSPCDNLHFCSERNQKLLTEPYLAWLLDKANPKDDFRR